MSKAACKEVIDRGADGIKMIVCLQGEAITDANNLTEAELKKTSEFLAKFSNEAEKLMKSFVKI